MAQVECILYTLKLNKVPRKIGISENGKRNYCKITVNNYQNKYQIPAGIRKKKTETRKKTDFLVTFPAIKSETRNRKS